MLKKTKLHEKLLSRAHIQVLYHGYTTALNYKYTVYFQTHNALFSVLHVQR